MTSRRSNKQLDRTTHNQTSHIMVARWRNSCYTLNTLILLPFSIHCKPYFENCETCGRFSAVTQTSKMTHHIHESTQSSGITASSRQLGLHHELHDSRHSTRDNILLISRSSSLAEQLHPLRYCTVNKLFLRSTTRGSSRCELLNDL